MQVCSSSLPASIHPICRLDVFDAPLLSITRHFPPSLGSFACNIRVQQNHEDSGQRKTISCKLISHLSCSSSKYTTTSFSQFKSSQYTSSLSFMRSLTQDRTFASLGGDSIRMMRRRRRFGIHAIFERFTERAIKAIIFSQREAKGLGKDMVFTHHLLLGLIAEENGSPDGFLSSGITVDKAREVVRSIWYSDNSDSSSVNISNGKNKTSVSVTDVPFSVTTKRVLEAAIQYSRTLSHKFIGPEHISIALFDVDHGSASRVLQRMGTNANKLAAVAAARIQGELAKDGRESLGISKEFNEMPSTKKTAKEGFSAKTKKNSALAQFCVDLTARASEGRIDPVIGREFEVQRLIQILSRKTKRNPILLGESGVGKTAIAEGLARRIAQADVPVFLLTKRVLSLDVGLLIAGAKERGELEDRVTKLISEILKSGDVILFIDEIHTLVQTGTVGRGSKGSGLDIGNLLKPALGRGHFQCIASTTKGEYRSHFEKDAALARRFQPIWVDEPSEENAITILMGLREKYEAHHKCRYTEEAIRAAVYVSARYIADRYLPDKAIDLIDEAGSKAHIEAYRRKKEQQIGILSKSPNDYWQEIKTVYATHEVMRESKIKDGYDSSAQNLKETFLDLLPSSTSSNEEPTVVGADDIAAVASLWSGIPILQLTADERMQLADLDNQLRNRVIGQDEAVAAICRAVKRSRVGLKDPKRPMAVMLFCGPTGVGKTELTKSLAACYFGSEAAMIRLDMSEYMERHSVSKLIGSPPGYVGYEEGGTLTEAIRRRPYTVLLLDEIEKAHPDVLNILLQLMEDGHLTDSQGRRVSFKNALVIMTSNVGSNAIAKGRRRRSFGRFLEDEPAESEPNSYAALKTMVIEDLSTYFRPELLNRIDEVVVFQRLKKREMLKIMDVMLREIKGRLISLGMSLEVSESIKQLVCRKGYDPTYGARHLRRAITSIIEDPLSEAILSGNYKPGDTAFIDLDASGKPFVTNGPNQIINISDATCT